MQRSEGTWGKDPSFGKCLEIQTRKVDRETVCLSQLRIRQSKALLDQTVSILSQVLIVTESKLQEVLEM